MFLQWLIYIAVFLPFILTPGQSASLPFVSQAKSVQEKLAEAILKEAQCSSEPELSDTSTEEEEESAHKEPGQADNSTRFSHSHDSTSYTRHLYRT